MMRKQKQPTKQAPIQLSNNKKSHSINMKAKQEQLFAPYKIEWKTPGNDCGLYGMIQSVPMKQPFRNVENNSGSRVFYQNMKNQLLNIKQDVEKLMMKQKTKDKSNCDSSTSRNDSQQVSQNNNGYIRTVNIKNKCQQKMSKVQSLYENVNNVLAGKICDSSNKFTVGESKIESLKNQNLFEHVQNKPEKLNLQTMYRSQKDTYARTKSRSIADNSSGKGIYFIDLTPKKDVQQNQQESQTQKAPITSSRPKIELNIDLPSFEKLKLQQKKAEQQKSSLIDKLKQQLHQLEKKLSQKDDKLSKQSSSKTDLNKQLVQLKTQISLLNEKNAQLQRLKEWQHNQLNNLHHVSLQQSNKIQFLQLQLQKALTFIKEKEQQNFHLLQKVDQQNNTILQLGTTCQQLGKQIKSIKQSSTDDKKLKQKLKLKQNQLYIYQQELKQAKLKIKQLKQTLQDYQQQNSQKLQQKESINININEKQNLIDQTQQFKWQVKEQTKIIDTLKSQNQRLKTQIHSFKLTNNQNQSKINQFFQENTQLRQRINQLEKDAQKAFQQILNTQGFQNIGQQISKKLSAMVDENYNLKNKISHLQSTLQQVTLRNRSLTQEVKIYEQKVSLQGDCARRLKIQDWDNLTQERDRLKIDLQKVQSRLQETKQFYELETMRKQNCIYELKSQINQMLQQETQKETEFHPNIKSVKHIKNLDSLFKGFKQMIDQNIAMKEQVDMIKKSLVA